MIIKVKILKIKSRDSLDVEVHQTFFCDSIISSDTTVVFLMKDKIESLMMVDENYGYTAEILSKEEAFLYNQLKIKG